MKLTLVIPTRNRAALAIAAIRSLLPQADADIEILVSDNSSSSEEARQLEAFVRGCGDVRVAYVRPPRELRMAAHWDWAAEQALARTHATHIGVQYDRKLWKPDALRGVVAACAVNARATVTYGCDLSMPTPNGRDAIVYPGSGKLYEIRTERIVELTSRARIGELEQAFPVFSNCIVPRGTLERMRDRFGSICDSAVPDSAFAFRFCAVEERYFHFDRAPVVAYSYEKSNGLAYFRGDTSGTYGDWIELWRGDPWIDAAPIPNLPLGQNVMFHEYVLVQRRVGDERFPPIDFAAYMRVLALGLPIIEDAALRAELQSVLERHGWREERPALSRRVIKAVIAPFRRVPSPPPHFATDAEAVQYLLQPRSLLPANPNLAALDPVEVPAR
jgi:glycosyltransferase involved in cell wall biosynthesis